MGEMDLRDFNRTFGELLSRASNPQKPLTEIGVLMISEMQENFRVEGRPNAWQKSHRAIKQSGQTLRDTGTLMHGLVSEVADKSVAAGPTMLGKNHITDPRVMKLLAFGGKVKRYSRSELFVRNRNKTGQFKRGTTPGRGMTLGDHTADYPARDYTYIPPESGLTFGQILQNYLLR